MDAAARTEIGGETISATTITTARAFDTELFAHVVSGACCNRHHIPGPNSQENKSVWHVHHKRSDANNEQKKGNGREAHANGRTRALIGVSIGIDTRTPAPAKVDTLDYLSYNTRGAQPCHKKNRAEGLAARIQSASKFHGRGAILLEVRILWCCWIGNRK